jgi:ATP-binding cassette, subfamily B, bacterial PglK
MRAFLRNMLFLFPGRDRLKLLVLLCAIIITAIFEVAGVASIMPFMALIASPEAAISNPLILRFSTMLHLEDVRAMQMAAGAFTLGFLFLSNMSALVANWLLLKFSHSRSYVVSNRLFKHYLAQDYAFFLTRNSSELGKNILSEVPRMSGAVIIPALQLIARSVVAFFMVSLLVVLYPMMTLVAAGAIGSLYAVIYLFTRRRLLANGRTVIAADNLRYRMASEAFGGIKNVLITGQQAFFESRFNMATSRYARCTAVAECLSLLPKYVLELIAFGGMVLIALYLLHTQSDPSHVLPTLAVYAFAGYRLMPAMQQIYGNMVLIRYHGVALTNVVNELKQLPSIEISHVPAAPMQFDAPLSIEHLSYAYPNGTPVLHDISLTIQPRTTVGFAGASGAGKTTLVDVVLGLLPPSSGVLRVGTRVITAENRRSWQALLGYVPQQIFLTDDTVAANIAFGLEPHEISQEKLERAAKRAHLHDFILSLPHGYQTVVGENGVRLSGGQRQRIGIARALYREPSMLILDEATSALDNITENAVMEAIAEMSGELTIIIIAHRLSTLKACTHIHLMDAGGVVASGSFEALLANSAAFRTLAQLSEAL